MQDLFDNNDMTGLAEAIKSGDVSAKEVLEFSLDRLDERNPAVNAVISERREEARNEVSNGLPEGPLHGVPFVIKDLGLDVAGLPSTNGSRLFADAVAEKDSTLVERYREAGLVVIGKTNTPEFGKNASTEPALFGPTRNPYGLDRSPGGSSGGTAVAVAVGIVPGGHASDGGGSIRIPASACGLVGLKPSRGRTPTAPARTLFSSPMSVHHALTRSVRDTALLLDLSAGPTVGDPYVILAPRRPYIEEVGADPGRLRIGLSNVLPDGTPVDPECAAVTTSVAGLLEELGHDVTEGAPNFPLDALTAGLSVLMGIPMTIEVDERLETLNRAIRDDDLEPMARMIYDRAKSESATNVVKALQELERAAQVIGAFFVDHDLLLTPTMARPAAPLGLLDTANPMSIWEHSAGYSGLTSPFNSSGQPAISLPMGHDSAGVPIGVQLVGAFGREDLLIQVASQLETARPWSIAPVWPPVPQ